jgi:aspartate kinase
VSVDLVATAEVSVSLTVDRDAPVAALVDELSRIARVEAQEERALVAIVGDRLKRTAGVAARVFRALDGLNVEMISMGANEINLSLVVREASRVEALRRLHRELFEDGGGAPIAARAAAAELAS